MRHLSVPKRQTEEFKRLLLENEWYAKGYRILSDGDCTLIPISVEAPEILPEPFAGIPIVVEDQDPPSPSTWLEYLPQFLPQSIIEQYDGMWPNSQEHLGDLVIFKIDREVEKYDQQVALAKASHSKKSRLILRDLGVKGDYRVRELVPLAARHDGELIDAQGIESLDDVTKHELTSTKVEIRENGTKILLDPSMAYYSNRLANERQQTVVSALELKSVLGRPLNVADPYCGVGPAILQLHKENELLDTVLANDLNPAAILLLRERMEKIPDGWIVKTEDALQLCNDEDMVDRFDVLLMNLPHNTLEHLPHLLPLLTKHGPRLVRGWAVVKEEDLTLHDKKLNTILSSYEDLNEEIKSSIRKQYNSTMVLTGFEARFGKW